MKLHHRMKQFLFLKNFVKNKNLESILILGSIDHLFDNLEQHNEFLKILKINNFNLDKYYERGRYSSRWFWEYLGFKDIDFIDTDGYFGAKDFDLNYDIKEKYGFDKQYDLVLNFGTTEHIFNQYNVFKNIHNLCKVSGYIFLSTPMQGQLNHGFYSYHPVFFEDLAKANCYIVDGMRLSKKSMGNKEVVYNEQNLNKLRMLDIIDDNIGLITVFKKLKDVDFLVPFQGNYLNIVKNEKLKKRYRQRELYTSLINKIGILKNDNIAIFGTARAGSIAYEKLKEFLNIVCFIDDFKTGKFKGIEIVNRDEFKKKYLDKVDCIIKGPYQKGLDKKELFGKKVIELNEIIT